MKTQRKYILEFEKPIVEIERRIAELKEYSLSEDLEIIKEIERLELKAQKLRRAVYSRLTRWQRVQLARHPERPYTLDYIQRIFTDFI
ncbi:MAG: acetyl-CoA carboxylase carboxyl transferase subunit alpha, partial [candidate division KSB1 bacterium]|nr:acetyl-CoA carboxylase carboxyl transferase subunit alpha [candidate division KSB1 bacterium]